MERALSAIANDRVPPIERSQYVQLRFFVNDQKHPLQQYQGLIQEIQVKRVLLLGKGPLTCFFSVEQEMELLERFIQR